ncbi:MAG: pantoate--beta-alanine ligase [Candidatus Humimicrobiaceae bacterium]
MKTIRTKKEMKAVSDGLKSQGKTLGFVPTMGYLHEGHVSLIKKSKKECDATIVSIFVNPIQFGPGEDFKKYPRDKKRDIETAAREEVDFLFMPDAEEMYGKDHLTCVNVEKMDKAMCGKFRPDHFRGVCTVVLKLFNIIKPDRAYFGEKDFQQLVIIKKMVKDLDVDIKIIGCKNIRETDGVAMSSRNNYLTEKERIDAAVLNTTILFAEKEIEKGQADLEKIKNECLELLNSNESVKNIDYFDFREPGTLEELKNVRDSSGSILIAAAVYIGKTRLIDNKVILV